MNEAQAFRDERVTWACDTFRLSLKPKGWASRGRGRDDWSFIPGSLLKQYKSSEVFLKGTAGVHFACGWNGLADLLERYGEDYALTNLERPRGSHASDDIDSLIDDSPMVDASQSAPSRENDSGEAGDSVNPNATQSNQQNENGLVITATDNSSLLTTLECLKKCREEITWLQNNPAYHVSDDTEACKEHMRETITNLYSQIFDYNDGNGNT